MLFATTILTQWKDSVQISTTFWPFVTNGLAPSSNPGIDEAPMMFTSNMLEKSQTHPRELLKPAEVSSMGSDIFFQAFHMVFNISFKDLCNISLRISI